MKPKPPDAIRIPLERRVRQLHERYAGDHSGEVATYIPALAAADPDWFGIAIVTIDGHVYEVGDTRQPFTIQSISKPFTYGLALEDHGLANVLRKVSVEPSGEAFNSISLAPDTGCPRNPMINAGAIVATSLVRGASAEERRRRLLGVLSLHAGHPLEVDPVVYASERDTGHRNRAIGHLLRNFDVITDDPNDALDLYFQQCSVAVDCRDLGVMAACLANGGVNPFTGERAIRSSMVPHVLSVMTTCGMYDFAGEWVFSVGMPAKSGVSGGILAVLPGQLGVGVFSPRLDPHGNSVRGVQVCRDLASEFGLHFLRVGRPAGTAVRRQYDLAQVGSRRLRSKRQRAHLDATGKRARVYDLAGDLGFAGIEVATRRVATDAAQLDIAVLDLSRVTRVDDVAVSVLADLIVDLDAHGKQLALVAAGDHPRLVRRLEEALAAGERPVRLVTFPDTDRALEWCERTLLASDATPPTEPSLPLSAHDLTRDLTAAELDALSGMLTQRRFEAGTPILRQGDPPDGLYLLLRGEASVTIDVPSGRRKRLATVSPGMSVGELAVVDRSPRSADVHADTVVECAVLSLEAFDRMSATHPGVKIKLLTNLLRAAAQRVFRLNEEAAALA